MPQIIDRDILERGMAIPNMIVDLSKKDKDLAIHYLEIWGTHQMPITPLFDELSKKLVEVNK